MPGLTERQAEILGFVRAHHTLHGFPPTLREIGERFGISSTNGVNDHLNRLERKGYIARDTCTARGIRIIRGVVGESLDLRERLREAGYATGQVDQIVAIVADVGRAT